MRLIAAHGTPHALTWNMATTCRRRQAPLLRLYIDIAALCCGDKLLRFIAAYGTPHALTLNMAATCPGTLRLMIAYCVLLRPVASCRDKPLPAVIAVYCVLLRLLRRLLRPIAVCCGSPQLVAACCGLLRLAAAQCGSAACSRACCVAPPLPRPRTRPAVARLRRHETQ